MPDLEPLPLEDEATRQKRREVAKNFFYEYIEMGGTIEEQIDAIAELISYDGDLGRIIQMMALRQE